MRDKVQIFNHHLAADVLTVAENGPAIFTVASPAYIRLITAPQHHFLGWVPHQSFVVIFEGIRSILRNFQNAVAFIIFHRGKLRTPLLHTEPLSFLSVFESSGH